MMKKRDGKGDVPFFSAGAAAVAAARFGLAWSELMVLHMQSLRRRVSTCFAALA